MRYPRLPFLIFCTAVTVLAATLPARAETCDARDNDGDGVVDEGCDLVCDAPRTAGDANAVVADAGISRAADLAWSGSQYGVAWIDDASDDSMCFARLDPLGRLDGFERCNHGTQVSGVSIAWSGLEWAVVYAELGDLFFCRFEADGDPLGCATVVTSTVTQITTSALVWNGSEYAVAWEDSRRGASIYARRVGADGLADGIPARVDRTGPAFNSAANAAIALGRAGTDEGYGVVWQDGRTGVQQIYRATLSFALARVASDALVSTNPLLLLSRSPSIAWNGEEYGVLWEGLENARPTLQFASFDADGQAAVAQRQVVGFNSFEPDLIWTGEEYQFAYAGDLPVFPDPNDKVYLARLSSAGHLLGPVVPMSGLAQSATPIVAWSGYESMVLYSTVTGITPQNEDVFARRARCCDDVDGDGTGECDGDPNDLDSTDHPGAIERCDGRDNNGDGQVDEGCDGSCDGMADANLVLVSALDASDPGNDPRFTYPHSSIATSAGGFAVAWKERFGDGKLRFLDSTGTPIGGETVLAGFSPQELVSTTVEYGVTGFTGGQCEYARFAPNGTPLGVVEEPDYCGIDQWNGAEFGGLVKEQVGLNPHLRLFRTDRTGNTLGVPVTLWIQHANDQHALAWTGEAYGVVRVTNELRFQLVDAAGLPVGTERIIDPVPGAVRNIQLVWTGSGFGVAWQHDLPQGIDEIRFLTLDATGEPASPRVVFSHATFDYVDPSLVWTGEEFGLAWGGGQVNLARIGADGLLIGSPISLEGVNVYGYLWDRAPSLRWTGTDYAMSFSHLDYTTPVDWQGGWEIWFRTIRCCENDVDGDGTDRCPDCNDGDPDLWATPVETTGLRFSNETTLHWSPPTAPGATTVGYDVLRFSDAADLPGTGTCLESGDESDLMAMDPDVPPGRAVFFYLVRAVNACPDGEGSLGRGTVGPPRVGPTCG